MVWIKFRLRRKTTEISIEPKQERDRTIFFTLFKKHLRLPTKHIMQRSAGGI